MPAMLEDPAAPHIQPPLPIDTSLLSTITPRLVTLRDRVTTASLLPYSHAAQLPPSLLSYLCQLFNLEIENGDTYPIMTPFSVAGFGDYWFQSFGAVMMLGEVKTREDVWALEAQGGPDCWSKYCLGTFYVKPNYPGRSNHVCNGGFIVTDAARNRGVGRLMGEGYLEWAPKLGYTYSIFNLVYETNVASIRIWDSLGFKRIGRIKDCGALRSYPDELVDAIIFGRDLGPEGEEFVSEERFDKIRYYLKHGKYPNGADRAEKSRLRSAAMHYKLLPAENPEDDANGRDNERLMLKDKEVISDPQRQYEIAKEVHATQHGGINKSTATIAEKYHWVRIKETVSLVIKNCPKCKIPAARNDSHNSGVVSGAAASGNHTSRRLGHGHQPDPNSMIERLVDFNDLEDSTKRGGDSIRRAQDTKLNIRPNDSTIPAPVAIMRTLPDYVGIPLDPQIIQHQQQHFGSFHGTLNHRMPSDTDGHESPQSMQEAPRSFATGLEYHNRHIGMSNEDSHFGLDLDSVAHQRMQHDHIPADTQLTTPHHIGGPDEPMTFVHEGEGEYVVDLGRKLDSSLEQQDH